MACEAYRSLAPRCGFANVGIPTAPPIILWSHRYLVSIATQRRSGQYSYRQLVSFRNAPTPWAWQGWGCQGPRLVAVDGAVHGVGLALGCWSSKGRDQRSAQTHIPLVDQ